MPLLAFGINPIGMPLRREEAILPGQHPAAAFRGQADPGEEASGVAEEAGDPAGRRPGLVVVIERKLARAPHIKPKVALERGAQRPVDDDLAVVGMAPATVATDLDGRLALVSAGLVEGERAEVGDEGERPFRRRPAPDRQAAGRFFLVVAQFLVLRTKKRARSWERTR